MSCDQPINDRLQGVDKSKFGSHILLLYTIGRAGLTI